MSEARWIEFSHTELELGIELIPDLVIAEPQNAALLREIELDDQKPSNAWSLVQTRLDHSPPPTDELLYLAQATLGQLWQDAQPDTPQADQLWATWLVAQLLLRLGLSAPMCLLTAALFGLTWYRLSQWNLPIWLILISLAFIATLIALAFIDFETTYLPDALVLPLLTVAIVVSFLVPDREW